MKIITNTLLAIHIFTGTIAVIVGLLSLLSRKPVVEKAGKFHRNSGKIFLYAMIVVIGTAILLTLISFNPYFAGLTAAAAIAVFSGYRVLDRKRPDLDESQRAKVLDWIVTLLIFTVGGGLIFMAVSGQVTKNLPVVFSLGIGSMLYAGYDIYRFTFPTAFPFSPNLWLYEHLVKMLGGYFGAVAAFSGSVLVLLPPPWRQLRATMLGQILAVILVVYYSRKMKRNISIKKSQI